MCERACARGRVRLEQENVDCVVVGAGAVGLACARALALAGREVVVLESADVIGAGISARNSEVIHAGIYYAKDSLKAKLCVAGRDMLYRYCGERGVEVRRCGKLIAAAGDAERAVLERLARAGAANGVDDLVMLDGREARAMEPELECAAALHSPSTGIFDSHGYMLALRGDAEDRGAALAFNSPVTGGAVGEDGIVLEVGGEAPMRLTCRSVVNSAGLDATVIAATLRGLPAGTIPKRYLAKGNYFTLAGRAPFTALVYPAPEPGGLGVHYSVDLGGQAKFGPDVEWIDDIDYDVDQDRADAFYAVIRRYWPGLPDGALQPAYAGIRPKLAPPGDPAGDFVIQGPATHGIPGLVNLYGIESPGLTSSLAIAEAVARLLQDGS